MPKQVTVVVYKPNSQSTDEYMVYVDPEQYRRWKDGNIVETYSVFHTGQGAQGLLKKPSNQQLDTIFGTHRVDDVVEFILKNGKPQHGDIDSNSFFTSLGKGMASLNPSRGNGVVDVRGRGPNGN